MRRSNQHRPMAKPTLRVYGYHGTTLEAAEHILTAGYKPSQNPWEWLGHGIYFWQDAPMRAYEWAREWARRNQPDAKPCVLVSEIALIDCIDMLDVAMSDRITASSQAFLAHLREAKSPLKNRYPMHNLDCSFFNYLARKLEREENRPVKGFRAAIVEGKPLFEQSPIYDRSHVQIVVRDPGIILNRRLLEP